MKIWNVALYARVSTDKKQQQESIPAQIQSLKGWLEDKIHSDKSSIYNLVEVYEDQGFSGSNFQRDSFLRMKEDIRLGKINMILTRDLSRFSRNYVMAGYYIEEYFKINNIRFVSILDGVDTLEEINDIIPFKNILNEMYIKDCSRKVRDALKQRMLRGSSIASKPPYGYKFIIFKEHGNKTIKLAATGDYTTEVVREIYELFLKGWGYGKIASYLNNKGIAPPSKASLDMKKLWSNETIKYILTNPKYAGMLVQQRWKKISYKLKKVRPTSEEEWIYGEDFQGIINKEVFYKVQEEIKLRGTEYRYKNNVWHAYSRIMSCKECGGKFSYRNSYAGYKCSNSQKGQGRCTAHSIKEEFLNTLVARELERYFSLCINKRELLKILKEKGVYQGPEEEISNFHRLTEELLKLPSFKREVIETFIDRVIVSENPNTKQMKIDIFYKFKEISS